MVKTYIRKSNRGEWSEEAMKNAVDAVIEGKMGYMLAAKTFLVPQTTLERKVKIVREKLSDGMEASTSRELKVRLGPKDTVFSKEEEKELCNYILDMESRLYGLTIKDLRSLAYNLAVKNNKPHPFNNDKKEAGKDWAYNFLKRHPELSIRQPESTSAARAAGFNKQVVDQFYNFLGNVYDENHLTPDRIFNCDETGISIVPKTKSKIIAKKGRKQVGAITSAERGTTITVEICFSASGLYMPPMMVFPRKRMDPQLMLNAAPGSWGVCSDSGWMTTELFASWFKKFVEFSGATTERPVLLLLDGHSTHTQNIDLINEARSNGVIILCFPPHTTHRLQVADVAYMRPLSTYYDHQITAWLRSNPGMVVTIRQVAEIFGKAFIQASTMSTAVNGFKKCGFWPYDPTVFTDTDFAPSLTTDIPQPEQSPVTEIPISVSAVSNNEIPMEIGVTEATSSITVSDNAIPSNTAAAFTSKTVCMSASSVDSQTELNTFLNISQGSEMLHVSSAPIDVQLQPSEVEKEPFTKTAAKSPEPECSSYRPSTPRESSFIVASPQQVMPFPATRKTVRASTKRGKTAIITSSPYKSELEDKIKKKQEENDAKEKRKALRELKKTQTKSVAKRNKVTKKKKKTNATQKSTVGSDNSGSDSENPPCLYCHGLYLESTEGWVACSACKKWAHCSCAGVEDKDEETAFKCEICL